ncbi:hypothetical protein [Vibrio harveyi]|uniref:hypothetical protein n=1 Tax=Vibrio harveyi TaxID=669 RepID=UPI003BB68273
MKITVALIVILLAAWLFFSPTKPKKEKERGRVNNEIDQDFSNRVTKDYDGYSDRWVEDDLKEVPVEQKVSMDDTFSDFRPNSLDRMDDSWD